MVSVSNLRMVDHFHAALQPRSGHFLHLDCLPQNWYYIETQLPDIHKIWSFDRAQTRVLTKANTSTFKP